MLVDDLLNEYLEVIDFKYQSEKVEEVDAPKIYFENVIFSNCSITGSNFKGSSLINVKFIDCNLTNNNLKDVYFKNVKFINCKLDGSNLSGSSLKYCELLDTTAIYCNFVNSLWEETVLNKCNFSQSFISETKLRKVVFNNIDFTKADFFKTKLKGIDFSNCNISNIMVSDTYKEIDGIKIDLSQTIELARLLNVKIK